jgi:hypothetical protein
MDNIEYKKLISDYSNLFWYTPASRKENLGEEQVVETFLNYGDEIAVKRLLDVMGTDRVAAIFYKQIHSSNRRKNNYKELVSHYFQLYFSRHAK